MQWLVDENVTQSPAKMGLYLTNTSLTKSSWTNTVVELCDHGNGTINLDLITVGLNY